MKIVILITILFLFLSANLYVAVRMYQLIPSGLLVRALFIVLIAICISSLFLFFIFQRQLSSIMGGLLYRIGTNWIIGLAYLILLFALIDLVKLFNKQFLFINKDVLYSITHNNLLTFFVVIGSVLGLLFIGNVNYHNKKRVHFTIKTSKLSPQQNQIRVVGISDLHLGYTIGAKELTRWVQLINAEKPDIVVIAGDLIDNNVNLLLEMKLDTILNKIEAPMGVYGALGNHEYIAGVEESIEFYKKANIVVLRDTALYVRNDFVLIGRDDAYNPNRKPLNDIVSNVDRDSFTLLLDHQPFNLEEAEREYIDLQFSGHTHKGQIFPVSLVVKAIFENPHGMIAKGLTQIYVSSGLGIWGGKFRLGTQSEYAVFDIKNKQIIN